MTRGKYILVRSPAASLLLTVMETVSYPVSPSGHQY